MDIVLELIVRLMVWLSRWASCFSRIGIVRYDRWRTGHKLKILLVGYNGARNTGADASLLPQSLGLPPILTIMALAKKISKIIIANS